MAVFAKDGIEIRNLLRACTTLVEPAEPVNEVEITGETDAQRKNREVRNQEKRVGWENHVIKAREGDVLCNSFRWDEADAKVRSYFFLMSRRRKTTSNTAITTEYAITHGVYTTIHDCFGRYIRNDTYNSVREV